MTDASFAWRKSSYSGQNSACVEIGEPGDGSLLVRNSNHPDAGTLALAPTVMATWVAGTKSGDLDDLAG